MYMNLKIYLTEISKESLVLGSNIAYHNFFFLTLLFALAIAIKKIIEGISFFIFILFFVTCNIKLLFDSVFCLHKI